MFILYFLIFTILILIILFLLFHLYNYLCCSSFCFPFCSVSPEFSYRTGLGAVAEGSPSGSSPAAAGSGSGGAPNRPLPPTPDDDESQGDKTLVLRRVSDKKIVKHAHTCCFHVNSKKFYFKPIIYVIYTYNDSSPRPV